MSVYTQNYDATGVKTGPVINGLSLFSANYPYSLGQVVSFGSQIWQLTNIAGSISTEPSIPNWTLLLDLRGAPNGLCPLDGTSRIPVAYLPTTSTTFLGVWNAATNDPTIVSGVGVNGSFYIVSVAGNTNIDGTSDWVVGDQIIFIEALSKWSKIPSGDQPVVTPNPLVANDSGLGASSGASFDGSSQVTLSYNTIGAPSINGANATGTWGVSITGNAATSTVLATPRNINGVSFNGGSDITISASSPFSATFSGSNTGAPQNTAYNGSSAVTIDRNTLNAPSKTGDDATGTWGIAISGNSGTATALETARNINGIAFDGTANITVTAATPNAVTFSGTNAGAASGSSFTGASVLSVDRNTLDAPSKSGADATGTWNIDVSGNSATATILQTARTINGVSFNGSTNITVTSATTNDLTINNLGWGDVSGTVFNGSVARTLSYNTIGSPSITGTNATGTWGISITGNSGSATVLQTPRTINGVSFDGSANISITSNTTNALTMNNSGTGDASGSTFNGSAERVLSYNSIGAPSVSGTNATGTWGISVTGNSGTATTLQTARTINGVSFNGSANINVNTVNSVTFNNGGAGGVSGSVFNGASALTVSYNTIGAPSTTGTNASGTWGINITGNSATVGGFTPSQTSAVANRVVVADPNGYIYNNYYNSTDNTQASGVTAVMVKAGDNFYRSGTAAAIATFISGQSMNIAGNATTATNVNYTPPANSIYGAATTISTALTNYDSWNPLNNSEGFVCLTAPAGGTGSIDHPLTSIQTAITNAAGLNNNYIIFPGTYAENLTIPSGTIVRLRAPHSRPALFLGSFESVIVNGTLTVSSGTVLIDGLQFSQATTISAVASGTITFVNCVFQNTVTVSGATGASIIFKGCYFSTSITSSSSLSGCQIQMTECTGSLNALFNVTTDLSLLYIDNCVNMPYLDYRGNNLYINRLLSIGKNPGTGMSIKQRGNGGAGSSGTFSIFYSNIRGDGTAGIDCSCNLLYYSSVLYNPGSSSIVATTKITDSAF